MLGFWNFLRALVLWPGVVVLVSAYPVFASGMQGYSFSHEQLVYEKYPSQEGHFMVSIPAGWSKKEKDFSHAYTQTGDRVYGVELSPPRQFDEVSPVISVLYYEYGQFFKDYDGYIRLKSGTFTRLVPEQAVPVMDVVLAGRAARQFEIETFELFTLPFDPPALKDGVQYELAPPSKKILFLEKYIVIPTTKGFYVLSYRTPRTVAHSTEAVFGKILNSFETIIK